MTKKDEAVDKLAVPISEHLPQFSINTIASLLKTPTMPARYVNSDTGVQDAWATVLFGAELGVGPLTSMHDIYLVNGGASMKAKLMLGLVQRAGHYLKFNVKPDEVAVTGFRKLEDGSHVDVGTFTFGKDDAERAEQGGQKLSDKDTYKSYPIHMYTNRAISMACRYAFPECLAGIGHIPEEMGIDEPPELVDYIDVEVEDG